MRKKIQGELDNLKREYLALEKTYLQEKECLLKVAGTFGLIVDMSPPYRDAYQEIKQLLHGNSALAVDTISQKTGNLRSSIFAEEMKADRDAGNNDQEDAERNQLAEAYSVLDTIAVTLTDDFYPVYEAAKLKSGPMRFDCSKGISPARFNKDAARFLVYLGDLKDKISQDFQYANDTFLSFFNHVRELEKELTRALDADGHSKGIFEEFEQKLNQEVSSIADSFSLHSTISEVQKAVIDRLSNIRQIVTKKTQEEKEKHSRTQKQILGLRKKILQAEVETRKLSIQADRFKEEANKDGLTGLYNRMAFDAMIANTVASFNQGGDSFSIVMFDVDNFKWVNDTFGHVAGDKILKEVAAVLRRTFRKDEFIARYGGDEFVVVIAGLSKSTARQRIATFESNFKKMRFFSHKDGDVKIGISVGIASVARGDTPEDLLHRADTAMYEMKKKRKTNPCYQAPLAG
jgi:diguanylate cyclase (GGDEF)-like protein